jgi:hypothetical protein
MAEWKIARAWTSAEGSSGVIFVSLQQDQETESKTEIAEQQVYVLKSSSRIAEEIFANRSIFLFSHLT